MKDHPSRLPVAEFPWFALAIMTALLAVIAPASTVALRPLAAHTK